MADSLSRVSIGAACAAGIAGTLVLDAFVMVVPFPDAPNPSIPGFYTFVATVLAGPSADGAPWAVPIGIIGHAVIGIAWAYAYLSLARVQPQLVYRPWLSGLAFGLIVGLVMNAALVVAGKYAPITAHAFDRDLLAYTVFFGVPLALVAARVAPTTK